MKSSRPGADCVPAHPTDCPSWAGAPGVPNLVVAAGHAMIGVSLGPVTGKLVGQIVAGERTEIDLLAVDRFAD